MGGQGKATRCTAARKRPGRKLRAASALFATFAATLLAACGEDAPPVLSLGGQVFGTTWSLKVVDDDRSTDEAELSALVETAFAQVDRAASNWREDSEVSAALSLEPGEVLEISADLVSILETTRQVHEASHGAFDPTVGPLVAAYGFGAGASEMAPSEEELLEAASKVDFAAYQWADGQLTRSRTGVSLDLSGVAKGYAVDLAAEALLDAGETRFMLEVGGEICVAGNRADDTPWVLGIYEPVVERAIHGTVRVRDLALATSGDYRAFREATDGTRVSHTIDPRRGRAATSGVASVTILAPHCALADALATAVMVLGPKEGLTLVEQSEGVEAYLLVHSEGETFEIQRTQGFPDVTPWDSSSPR